jgi:predicted ribosomally synthesized peptide with SipW-like signal peptide
MKWINYKKRIFRRVEKSLGKIGIFVGVICFAFYGILMIGETNSYFNDTETSNVNTFSAGTLDFGTDSSGDFSPAIIDKGESATRTINLNQNGSLDFQYTVSVNNLSGDSCDYLNLTATLDGTDIGYTGLLKDFTYGPIVFSVPEEWIFTTTLQADAPDSIQGKICNFDFVFDGTQISGNGFYDQETINNNVTAKYWDPPVVLNEILPNPTGDDTQDGVLGEWVEIFNKTSDPIDLDGWYVKDSADNKIIIQTTNTLDNSTTINANGWLVLFMNDDILNNDGDTISLYNSDDILFDSYTYTLPEYNVNGTPGLTNDIALYLPLDDDLLDQSGNNNNGTNYGATFISSLFNEGLSFDGINNYVEVADSSSLNIASQITMEAWIKPLTTISSTNSNMRIIDKQNAYYLLFDYPGANGRLKLILRIGGNYIDLSSTTNNWNAGQWYHIVGTYDGSMMKIYVNGALENSKSITGDIENTHYKLFFGTRAVSGIATNMFFDGVIDEIKIYNRSLNDTEIVAHYGQVPENKSYARIPDGSSNWIDPIPTPGQPNIREEQTEIIDQESVGEFENINNINLSEFVVEIVEEVVNQSVQGKQTIEEPTEEILEETELPTEPIVEIVEENTEEVPITETEEILATEEQIITEEQATEQAPTIEEAPIIEETPIQEAVIESEPIIETEPVIEEPTTEELMVEEPVIEEPIVEEPILSE